MYKVIHNSGKYTEFQTKDDAQAFLDSKGRAKCFFKIEKVEEPKTNLPAKTKTSWKDTVVFDDVIQITRDNVKNFYGKSGYIKVVDAAGKVKHIGKTTNMGKVFSNYVNCAKYNQSYDYNEMGGDKLFFKESAL